MCGFVAVLATDGHTPDPALVGRMGELIAHRGPDDDGSFAEQGAAFTFRRLAIFDLAQSAHQPMHSPDGRYVMVFNGAIYNYPELRSELQALGHVFRSTGDTEVLLAAYRQWGHACLPRLNGMWAFVVYDRQARTLFAARDRFGIKPLFWYRDGRGIVFTSEIKTLRDSGYASLRPDWQTIAQFFLENELDAGPHTLYAGVERVPAGCYFHGDASAAPVFHRYWSVLEAAAEIAPPRDPVREFRELFDDAVRLRTRSDVPVGVLLSGGLDSTSIAATMAAQADDKDPPQTLSALCYLDPAYDETAFINATLEQTGASLYRLDPNPDELWDALRRHLWYQDEPVHSFTSVVAFQLMQLARERGLKVMLNGQGADEVLAGYLPFFVDHWADLARAGRIGDVLAETRSFAQVHEQALGTQYRRVAHRLFNQAKQSLPGHKLIAARWKKASLLRNPLLSDDLKSHWAPSDAPPTTTLTESLKDSVERSALPLYLRVEDRNAMAHGVEVRVPFLDHRLVAYGFRLGSEWKLSGGDTKVILRQAMQGRIPEAIRRSPKKLGFPTSANNWLRTVFYERCTELLLSRESRQSGVWNVDALEKTLMRRGDGVERAGRWLFNAAQFAMWYTMSRFATLLLWIHDAAPEISGV